MRCREDLAPFSPQASPIIFVDTRRIIGGEECVGTNVIVDSSLHDNFAPLWEGKRDHFDGGLDLLKDPIGPFKKFGAHLFKFGSAELILTLAISLSAIEFGTLFKPFPVIAIALLSITVLFGLDRSLKFGSGVSLCPLQVQVLLQLALAVLESFNGALIVTEDLVDERLGLLLLLLLYRLLRLRFDRFPFVVKVVAVRDWRPSLSLTSSSSSVDQGISDVAVASSSAINSDPPHLKHCGFASPLLDRSV